MKGLKASKGSEPSRPSRPPRVAREAEIRAYYRGLATAWGPQHWWPAHTPFEVIVGAFLTQNTTWTNVERALANLRAANVLSLEGIRSLPLSDLERLIRSSGYFRQKAGRLKSFVEFVDHLHAGSLDKLFVQPTSQLREELLAQNGVGPETADSILLYAGNHPVFVVDAYTRRILNRHRILPQKTNYEEIRQLFEQSLAPLAEALAAKSQHKTKPSTQHKLSPSSTIHLPSPISEAPRTGLAQIYNEMHGLIVAVGKHYCRKSQPLCDGCPLQPFLPRNK